MVNKKHRPADVTVNKQEHALHIEWNDGRKSVYDLNQLREACPCVFCRGGHDKMGREHDPLLLEIKPVQHYKLENVQLSGNYALQFFWEDGHNSGIYSWEYLRRLDEESA